MSNTALKINTKVPRKYAKKKYLNAIGMGLFDLAFGEVPPTDEIHQTDELISVRFALSPKAASYWEYLLPMYKSNKRKLARDALHLVTLEPECSLRTRI